jgi:hypothetical protein
MAEFRFTLETLDEYKADADALPAQHECIHWEGVTPQTTSLSLSLNLGGKIMILKACGKPLNVSDSHDLELRTLVRHCGPRAGFLESAYCAMRDEQSLGASPRSAKPRRRPHLRRPCLEAVYITAML